MSEPVRFRSIEISGFRGFRDAVRFDLDASAVILEGPNGTGKTSFCDAIQWLLLGNLSRFERFATRRDVGYIGNMYSSEDATFVRAEMSFDDVGEVTVQRTGRTSPGHLEWVDSSGRVSGDAAELRLRAAFGLPLRADFDTYILRAAVLQQDMIRSVLEDKPADRFKSMVALLGLDEVQDFLDAVRTRSERAAEHGQAARNALRHAEGRAATAAQQLQAIEERLEARPDVQEAQHIFRARIEQFVHFPAETVAELVSPDDIDAAATLAERLGTELRHLHDRRTDLRARREQLPPDLEGELASLVEERSLRTTLHEQSRAALTDAVAADRALNAASEDLSELAALAIPLLNELCPVCGQPIETEAVRARLVEGSEAALAALEASRRTVTNAKDQVEETQRALAEVEQREAHLRALQAAAARIADDEGEWAGATSALEAELRSSLGMSQESGLEDDATRESALHELRQLWSALTEWRARTPSMARDTEVVTARSTVAQLEEAVLMARDRARAASQAEEEATSLLRATTRASAAVTARRSSVVGPIIQEIFERLDPHPTLKTLDFDFDVYYERGSARPMIRDASADIEANPLLVLSSSQTNVAALSFFLALGWATGRVAAGFVLLDDPLQSLDDVNALGFADVCRHLRNERQLIVSTHDRRLSSLLRRKLAPRLEGVRTVVLEFHSWGKSGPVVETHEIGDEAAIGARRIIVGTSAA